MCDVVIIAISYSAYEQYLRLIIALTYVDFDNVVLHLISLDKVKNYLYAFLQQCALHQTTLASISVAGDAVNPQCYIEGPGTWFPTSS